MQHGLHSLLQGWGRARGGRGRWRARGQLVMMLKEQVQVEGEHRQRLQQQQQLCGQRGAAAPGQGEESSGQVQEGQQAWGRRAASGLTVRRALGQTDMVGDTCTHPCPRRTKPEREAHAEQVVTRNGVMEGGLEGHGSKWGCWSLSEGEPQG